jgi:hypothetical protein
MDGVFLEGTGFPGKGYVVYRFFRTRGWMLEGNRYTSFPKKSSAEMTAIFFDGKRL